MNLIEYQVLVSRMNLIEYQDLASRTLNYELKTDLSLATMALGLSGESGEVAELIKKALGHGHPLDLPKLRAELGDVLWYVAGMATVLGISLEQVASENIEKLRRRYPDGFSAERSINRVPNEK